MKRKTVIAVVALGVLVAGGLLIALKADSVSAASDAVTQVSNSVGLKGKNVSIEDLAEALGISLDEFEEAKLSAMESLIDQAVELGFITQEQANELKSREFLGRMGLHRYLSLDEMAQLDFKTFFFEALGITEEDYQAAIETVQQERLEAAVADGKLTQVQADAITGWQALRDNAKFKESIKNAYTAAIEAAFEDGTITQAQADAMLAELEDGHFNRFERPMIPGRDRRDGRFPGMRMGEDPAQESPLDIETDDGEG
jgi:hypothetical protein